jgi:hypothetical protein
LALARDRATRIVARRGKQINSVSRFRTAAR